MSSKIKTREQAEAVIRAINAKPVRTHQDQVVLNSIAQAKDAAKTYLDWGQQIEHYAATGDVVLERQAIRQRGEYVQTRMSELAKVFAGIKS